MDRIESKFIELAELMGGFKGMIEKVLVENSNEVGQLICEQLLAGVDGDEHELIPTYTGDEYFKKYGKDRMIRAQVYRDWKNDITPPEPSKIGFRERNANTPNLIINGKFHRSIKAEPISGGLRIGTQGIDFGKDVESKYGNDIFKVSRTANKYFIKRVIRKKVLKYFGK